MDLLHHLLHLEQRLLSRVVREDAAELALLIADDFVEFGAGGGRASSGKWFFIRAPFVPGREAGVSGR